MAGLEDLQLLLLLLLMSLLAAAAAVVSLLLLQLVLLLVVRGVGRWPLAAPQMTPPGPEQQQGQHQLQDARKHSSAQFKNGHLCAWPNVQVGCPKLPAAYWVLQQTVER